MHKSLLTAAAIAALSVASSASAQEKLKFAVFTPEAEMTHQVVMKPWAERVSKESGGTLDIQTFPSTSQRRPSGPHFTSSTMQLVNRRRFVSRLSDPTSKT